MDNIWKAYWYIIDDNTHSVEHKEASLTLLFIQNKQGEYTKIDRYVRHKFDYYQIVKDLYTRIFITMNRRLKLLDGARISCSVI